MSSKPDEQNAPPSHAPKVTPPKNVLQAALPSTFFTTGDSLQGVAALHQAAVAKASDAIAWYVHAKGRSRIAARLSRGLALLLGSATTLLPLASGFMGDDLARPLIASASMCGIGAATLIAVDKFFGFSSGWMRYVGAMQTLERRLEQYVLDWNRRALAGEAAAMQSDRAVLAAAVDRIAAFLDSVADVLQGETHAWATEFRGNLADFEAKLSQERSALPAGVRSGALKVEVTGWEQLEDKAVWARLNDRTEMQSQDGVVALTDVSPGVHRIQLRGRRGAAEVRASDVVTVKAGDVTSVKVTLS